MRKVFKFLLALLGGLLLVIAGLFVGRSQLKQSPAIESIPVRTVRHGVVDYVIDGDTIVLESGERIRYLGIDAPEKDKPFFAQATAENKKLVEDQEVSFELDVQEKDKYGRTLAYIWLEGKMINLELAKLEYVEILVFPPNLKYQDEFLEIKKD